MDKQIINNTESDITIDFILKIKMLKQEDKMMLLALLAGMELQSSIDKTEKININKIKSKYLD